MNSGVRIAAALQLDDGRWLWLLLILLVLGLVFGVVLIALGIFVYP